MNSCHGNNKHKNGHKGSHMGHMWMMVLCCGAPILILLLLPLIGNVYPSLSGYISRIVPFVCPIMMVAMIPMMFRKEKGSPDNSHCESKQLEIEDKQN